MKRVLKKALAVVLVMALVFGVTQTTQDITTQAASNEYMKNLNLKWDLKEGKNLTLTLIIRGLENKNSV